MLLRRRTSALSCRVLAADVERHVVAVDDALDEAQPVGQQAGRLGLNQHLAREERHARLDAVHAKLLAVRAADVEERADVQRRVGLVAEREARLVERVRHVLVELLVLLVGDAAGALEPQRLHGVDDGAADADLEADKVAVLLDDALERLALRVLLRVALQLQRDARAARQIGRLALGRLADLVRAGAVRRPAERARRVARAAAQHRHLVGDHERRVEADAKLADDVGGARLVAALARLGQLLPKLLRAALANAPEQLHHFVARQSDAAVLNRQRALVKVARQRNVHVAGGGAVAARRHNGVPTLLHRVARIRNQLAQEDFLLQVKRVRHNVEQLARLRLKLELLGRCRRRRKASQSEPR
jgi:hypothetical protein